MLTLRLAAPTVVRLVLATLLLLTLASPVPAQQYWIDGGANIDFEDPGNWSSGSAPTSGTDIDWAPPTGATPAPRGGPVDFNSQAEARDVSVWNYVTWNLNGHTFNANSVSVRTDTNYGVIGTLTAQDGFVNTDDMLRVGKLDEQGMLRMDSVGWESNTTDVGMGSQGTIELLNGSVLDTGSLTIGEEINSVAGTGAVLVTNSSLQSNGTTVLGENDRGTGLLSVSGASATTTFLDNVTVGKGGQGRLVLDDNARATFGSGAANNNVRLGSESTGAGQLEVTGGAWFTNIDNLSVGEDSTNPPQGRGEVLVSDGGSLSANAIDLFEQGSMTVDNATVTAYDVGVNSSDTLTVRNGASLAVTNELIAGGVSDGAGRVVLDGAGTSVTAKRVRLGQSDNASGALEITGGAVLTTGVGWADWSVVGDHDYAGTGTVRIEGEGSTWNVDQNLGIGTESGSDRGAGSITVGQGGTLDVLNMLAIGHDSALNIDGGSVTVSVLGRQPGSTFRMTDGRFESRSGPFSFFGSYTETQDTLSADGAGDGVFCRSPIILGKAGPVTGTFTNGAKMVAGYDDGPGGITMGDQADASASLVFDGQGSDLVPNGDLIVGNNGSAELTLQNGAAATVENTGSNEFVIGQQTNGQGTIHVDGGSLTTEAGLVVGSQGTGVLNVRNGGTLTSQGDTVNWIGRQQEGTGTVLIDGGTANIDNQVIVGLEGTGSLVIRNDASATINSLEIGVNDSGNGSVEVDDASLSLYDGLLVGDRGTAELAIRNDAMVTITTDSDGVMVGEEFDSQASVVISSGGTLKAEQSDVNFGGHSQHTTVRIDSGGQVIVGRQGETRDMNIAFNSGQSSVTVTDAGSKVDVQGDVHVGGADGRTGGTAELRIKDDAQVNVSGELRVNDNDSLLSIDGGHVSVGAWNAENALSMNGGSLTSASPLLLQNHDENMARTYTLRGSDSHMSTQGMFGAGVGEQTLNVLDGASINQLNPNMPFRNAFESDSQTTLNVSGFGSKVEAAGGMALAVYGSQDVLISNGGQVSQRRESIPLALATQAGSSCDVTVTGAGSLMEAAGQLHVGGFNYQSGGDATLTVSYGGEVRANQTTTLYEYSVMTLRDGTLQAGDDIWVREVAELAMDGGSVRPTNSQTSLVITNAGLLHGDGRIEGSLDNGPSGTVRVGFGQTLRFLQATHDSENQGRVDLAGGTLQFADPFNNLQNGVIAGRGAMIFGETDGLINRGQINLAGDTDIYGRVVNGDTVPVGEGEIVISGGASVAFHGDVTHGGEKFKISDNANAAFFGTYNGQLPTGGGGAFFEGTFSPGFSPYWAVTDVDITLGEESTSEIELAGLTATAPPFNTEYDIAELTDGADLGLDGTLEVVLLDGYEPTLGETFWIFRTDPGHRIGEFAVEDLPVWGGDLTFDVLYEDTGVTLQVVPEPATLGLLIAGGLGLIRRRRGGTRSA